LRAAFRELLFLVLDPEAEQPRNPMVRNIMIREGFAYRDDNTNKLVVPGTLLQQQVLRMAALPLTIEKDESATDAGRAIIRAADGSIHQFSLDGILFRVLNLLWCHPGRTFSSPEIQERAPLKDDRAVLNAMHRLREKLDQYGAGDWLQSERQRGYQFDMPLD
jgi:hypothetical protein